MATWKSKSDPYESLQRAGNAQAIQDIQYREWNEEAKLMARNDKHTVIYYKKRKSNDHAKAFAGIIRANEARTTLAWSHLWKGSSSMLREAKAVVIEEGAPQANKIFEAYTSLGVNVGVHWARYSPEDDALYFVGDEDEGSAADPDPVTEAELPEDPPVSVEAESEVSAPEDTDADLGLDLDEVGGEVQGDGDPEEADPGDGADGTSDGEPEE